METLESERDELLALDQLRSRARTLREATVRGIAQQKYQLPPSRTNRPIADKDGHCAWDAPTDAIELAVMLSVSRVAEKRSIAFGDDAPRAPLDLLAETAFREDSPYEPAVLSEEHLRPGVESETGEGKFLDQIPTLRFARWLHEFVARPGRAFDLRAALCYYRVVLELYSTGHPDWVIGSARASEGSAASAFITNECVRAILSLRACMAATAEFFDEVADFCERDAHLQQLAATMANPALEPWHEREKERSATSLVVRFNSLRRSLLFDWRGDGDHFADASFRPDSYEQVVLFVTTFGAQMSRQLERGARNLRKAMAIARDWRSRSLLGTATTLEELEDRRRLTAILTASGHEMALHVMERGAVHMEQLALATKACETQSSNWRDLARRVEKASDGARRTLRPTAAYMSSVLDREIAAAESPGAPAPDGPEMVFAATAFGAITGRWDDPRLLKAARILDGLLEEDGRLPRGRPFQTRRRGYVLHVAPSETIRALARLIQMVHYPLSAESAAKLLRYYERAKISVTSDDSRIGFGADAQANPRVVAWWATALAVNALDRIVRMLNAVINRRVLRHFNARRHHQLKVRLTDLVAADYGLCCWKGPAEVRGARVPVGIWLEAMRAHLFDCDLPRFGAWVSADGAETVGTRWSAILYGPPGTGKTTAMEALARSAGRHYTLVTITPSDLVINGMEQAEKRAQTVMSSLGLLTDAVILFDEFDEFIRKRRPNSANARVDIFNLIIPGMLTKFADLHRAAEVNRLVYALATNWIGNLEEAATREGRFDLKIGLYPPDLLSRWGAITSNASLLKDPQRPSAPLPLNDETKSRILDIVAATGLGPMSQLGRPGWLARPTREQLSRQPSGFQGTPMTHLLMDVRRKPRAAVRELEANWWDGTRYSPERMLDELHGPNWRPLAQEFAELAWVSEVESCLDPNSVGLDTWDRLALGIRQYYERSWKEVVPDAFKVKHH